MAGAGGDYRAQVGEAAYHLISRQATKFLDEKLGSNMGSIIQKKLSDPPSLKTLIHARHHHPGSSRDRLEATAAVLTGAASIYTIERALPMWLASRVARHPDHLAMRCANGMMIRTVSA